MKGGTALCALSAVAWCCSGRLNVPWSGGEIHELGRKGEARFAYFSLVGPIRGDAYRKWFVSAVAMAKALANHGSNADFVLICARVDSVGALAEDETRVLVELGVLWRYVSAPGRLRSAGFHLGNYKLSVWQHVEYDRVQLLDADVLPTRSMDDLFQLNGMLSSSVVACPGRVSPLNAGWIALVPDARDYSFLVALLDALSREDAQAPWGRTLDGWYDCGGGLRKPGWDFFDARGNQGHLYSYFRFDSKSLAILLFDNDYRLVLYNATTPTENGGGTAHQQKRQLPLPPAPVTHLLLRNFPCPFPSKRRGLEHSYIHYTGQMKPWRSFKPQNPQFLQWYLALLSIPAASEESANNRSSLLYSVFPKIAPATLIARTREAAAAIENASRVEPRKRKRPPSSRDGNLSSRRRMPRGEEKNRRAAF